MMIPFISIDDLLALKTNISQYAQYFTNPDNTWIEQELGHTPFMDSKYPMPDWTLDMANDKPYETDSANVQIVYDNFRFLSDSQASDERLWAGLCMGPCWEYVQYRWDLKAKPNVENIKQHFFFGFGARRSLTRNALSRLWWIGRLTYDDNAESGDPYELTKYICANSRYIVDVLERNTSNNPMIIHAFLHAVMEAEKEGIKIDSNRMRDLEKYLDLLGGTYILDCLSEEKIKSKILEKARELFLTKNS